MQFTRRAGTITTKPTPKQPESCLILPQSRLSRSGKRIEVKGYVAEVGVHNGRKFLGPVRRLDLTKTGTEVSTEEAVVLKDYVANDMRGLYAAVSSLRVLRV
eukprot:2209909-Rhodomonas_salina.1